MIVRGAFRYAAAIHAKEARAQLLGLSRASRDPRMRGLRLGSLGDNVAAFLSFEKGRARDRALLQLSGQCGSADWPRDPVGAALRRVRAQPDGPRQPGR